MAFSFFTPIKDGNTKFSNSTNDYTAVRTITHVQGNCLHNCTNRTFPHQPYKKKKFDHIKGLKGISSRASKNITNIFREFSYCLPPQLKADFYDNDSLRRIL